MSPFVSIGARQRWLLPRAWSVAPGIDTLNDHRYWNFHPYLQRTYHAQAAWSWR